MRHHFPGADKSSSDIKSSLMSTSPSSFVAALGDKTGPGLREIQTMNEDRIMKVRVYVATRWKAKSHGFLRVTRWNLTSTRRREGCGARMRKKVV